jgi:hypothetical protein
MALHFFSSALWLKMNESATSSIGLDNNSMAMEPDDWNSRMYRKSLRRIPYLRGEKDPPKNRLSEAWFLYQIDTCLIFHI